ncbi:hypothetical protein CK203_106954 [Vitis vinifera]|uniref:Reverse transcriptase domain-containing protein n=1 Tax=Vitis vinifera TaxID=29760 RepID=A0A438FDJ0_VITVI|nr:hypothetical protein CK203_106954 [Vitis vinifera]
MANAHRRANNLVKIKINGVRLTEDQEISLSEAEELELPFSEAEIYAALMGMNGDKAPGLDGFTVAFWQNCWEIVKEDVLDMFKEFYDQNSFIKSLNHTFLVLANRLKKIIGKVISPDQNAFIKGKQILDGSLIANEYQLAVPIKGYAKDGLRVKMDRMDVELYLHYQILNAGEWGSSWILSKIWKGRGQVVNISHLLFADDTIVFCEAKKESLLYLSWILVWFEAASGLKINLEKSMVIPVGEVEGVLDMAAEIG